MIIPDTNEGEYTFTRDGTNFRVEFYADLEGDCGGYHCELFVGKYEIDTAALLGGDVWGDFMDVVSTGKWPDVRLWVQRVLDEFVAHPDRQSFVVDESHWAWEGE